MKKRILSTLLAAALIAASGVSVFADETAAEELTAGYDASGDAAAADNSDSSAADRAEDEGEHHAAYITGYSDGTVRPSKKLKRAEAVQMLHNINSENPAPSEGFAESPQITRGEFAKLVLAAGGSGASQISDFMTGYPDGTLGLERTLTRAEAVTMINRAYGRSADSFTVGASMDLRIFPDVTTEHWAYMQLMEAVTDHHVMLDDADGSASEDSGEEIWSTWESGTVDLPQGWRNINGNLFYVTDQKLFAYNTTVNGIRLDENGRYTTGSSELDGLLRVEIQKIINNNMTQEQKLRAVYDYMIDNYSYRGAGTPDIGTDSWNAEYAINMLKSGKGNCYSWAATFTYLARQSGWYARAVAGTATSPKGSVREHAWTMINIDGTDYTFDSELEGVYAKTVGETYDLFMKKPGEAVWGYQWIEIDDPVDDIDVNIPADEALVKILDQIYEGVDCGFDLEDAAVTPVREVYYTGVSGLDYKAGVAREPLINAIAHSGVLLEMKDGAEMEAAVSSIKENVDGYKWICVGVSDENILVEYSGNYIFLVMDNDDAAKLMDNFKKLSL